MAEMQNVNDNKDGENVVLCGASSYTQKYFFNQQFAILPEQIQQELHVTCVLFTEDVGGEFFMEFAPDGTLNLKVMAKQDDFLFDDIGSDLKIKQIRREKAEFLESLELYYKLIVLKKPIEEVGGDGPARQLYENMKKTR
ncbi:MAG: DUF6145 family protein [Bacillota bacterium]|uniref:Uncharacterized protein n=2 Tax=[Clostridium] aminophilum TaxID=1526 RepID=A0A1I6IB14_9FIRM|nr:DUF6145 family protein [[Clostridium] aminophilum]MCR4629787.1 DUF6145 family protein [Clostridium sp.]MDT3844780.1 DUF6145 family protein [Bacillota bacterium]SFR63861.1 hypothetical protein SAMN02910262_00140 [[Clostridium] aminophilum]